MKSFPTDATERVVTSSRFPALMYTTAGYTQVVHLPSCGNITWPKNRDPKARLQACQACIPRVPDQGNDGLWLRAIRAATSVDKILDGARIAADVVRTVNAGAPGSERLLLELAWRFNLADQSLFASADALIDVPGDAAQFASFAREVQSPRPNDPDLLDLRRIRTATAMMLRRMDRARTAFTAACDTLDLTAPWATEGADAAGRSGFDLVVTDTITQGRVSSMRAETELRQLTDLTLAAAPCVGRVFDASNRVATKAVLAPAGSAELMSAAVIASCPVSPNFDARVVPYVLAAMVQGPRSWDTTAFTSLVAAAEQAFA